MAVNEVSRDSGQPESTGPDPSAVAKSTIDKMISDLARVRAKAGVKIEGRDDLGPSAQTFLDNILAEIEAAVGPDGKVPPQLLNQLRRQLVTIEKMERHVQGGPPGALEGDHTVDGRQTEIKDDGVITGVVNEGLKAFLRGFGLGTSDKRGNVVDVLRDTVGKNLADGDTWKDVGGKMFQALINADGDLAARLGQVVQAGTEAVVENATKTEEGAEVQDANGASSTNGASNNPQIDKFFGVTPRAPFSGNGLENTAGRTSNTGSMTNAAAIRAQLLTGLTGENPQVVNVAGKVCGEIFRDLGVFQGDRRSLTPEEKTQKKQIHQLITKELNDLQVDGKIDATALLDRLAQVIKEKSPDDASAELFASLTDGLKQLVAKHPEANDSVEVMQSIALGASMALSDVVALELGQEPKYRGALTEKLVPMLSELVSTGTIKDPDAPPEPGKIDLSRYEQHMDLPPETKELAQKFLASAGANPDHERYPVMVNVLAEIFHESKQRGMSPVVGAYLWLNNNAGLSPRYVEQIANHMGKIEPQIMALEQLKETRIAEYRAEDSKLGSEQDHGRLQTLRAEVASLDGQIRKLHELPQQYMQHAAQMIADTCVNGTKHGDLPPPGEPPVPPNLPPTPPGGGDDGGPGGPMNRGRNLYSRGNMPGMTSHAGPHDKADEPFYQRRANMLGDILADSSLCIEDKIFFFMMWFVAFADEEREKKMEELIQMDRRQAELAELKDQTNNELQSMYGTRKTQRAEHRQATDHLQRLQGKDPPASPEELAQAQQMVEQTAANVGESQDRITELETRLQQLKRDADELPKSREVKFMELERLNQLRDKIMNMARSILENSNRNIEKIFR